MGRLAAIIGLLLVGRLEEAVLSGNLASLSANSTVNLSAGGAVDWVHWGLYTESSLNRKAGVTPRIGDFTVIGSDAAFLAVYKDNANVNYNWSDGYPTPSVPNTTALVWVYGVPSIGAGFDITIPADTTTNTLKLYVGVFGAKGHLIAMLSDSSAQSYTNTSLVDQMGSWKGGVYTINYAAASAGQTLKIQWTLETAFRANGNVTLQAATLTTAGANNPPFATITAPTNNATFSSSANISIDAAGFDADGNVTKIEFFDGPNKLGEDTNSPFRYTWNNVPVGYHVLTARAMDNGGASRTGPPVDIFVNTSGGSLSGQLTTPPASVDLTAEGTTDWAHWGLISSNSFDHKAAVVHQISDFTPLGAEPAVQYANNSVTYSWSDGTPTASASGTDTGVYITGFEDGFQLNVPAETTTHRLKVYVGLYGAEGNFQAYLSDFSAPAYTDTSLSNFLGSSYALYSLDYAAASVGQSLTICYRTRTVFDMDFGNVNLQSATLVDGGGCTPRPPPAVRVRWRAARGRARPSAPRLRAPDRSATSGARMATIWAGRPAAPTALPR